MKGRRHTPDQVVRTSSGGNLFTGCPAVRGALSYQLFAAATSLATNFLLAATSLAATFLPVVRLYEVPLAISFLPAATSLATSFLPETTFFAAAFFVAVFLTAAAFFPRSGLFRRTTPEETTLVFRFPMSRLKSSQSRAMTHAAVGSSPR